MKMPVRSLSLLFAPIFVSILAALNVSFAQTLTVLHPFSADDSPSGNADGASPQSRLILSGNTLYGTAWRGGKNKVGTIFALNTDGADFRTLRTFAFSDGAAPIAGLLLSGTKLYGATGQGGNGNAGAIFALNTDGTGFTNLFHFAQIDTANRCSHCF